MRPIKVPITKRDGGPAKVVVTTRESKSARATVNVRLALPRRTLVLPGVGDIPPHKGEGGHPLAQFPLVMN